MSGHVATVGEAKSEYRVVLKVFERKDEMVDEEVK